MQLRDFMDPSYAALSILVLAACGAPRDEAAPRSMATLARLDSLIESCGRQFGECYQRIEDEQLAVAGGAAERRADGLHLRIGDDADTVLTALPGSALEFHAYEPGVGYYLIRVNYFEGDGYMMVSDRTGAQYHLDALPVFSPDSQRFVVASSDLEAQYNPTAVSVWRVTDTDSEMSWRYEPQGWGPVDPVWVSPDSVLLGRQQWVTDPLRLVTVDSAVILHRGTDGWVLTEMREREP